MRPHLLEHDACPVLRVKHDPAGVHALGPYAVSDKLPELIPAKTANPPALCPSLDTPIARLLSAPAIRIS